MALSIEAERLQGCREGQGVDAEQSRADSLRIASTAYIRPRLTAGVQSSERSVERHIPIGTQTIGAHVGRRHVGQRHPAPRGRLSRLLIHDEMTGGQPLVVANTAENREKGNQKEHPNPEQVAQCGKPSAKAVKQTLTVPSRRRTTVCTLIMRMTSPDTSSR
jgi:hypothetical protein